MDSVYFDVEGMLTCAVHHTRRKGWRSIPKSESRPGTKHGSYLTGTPAQIEGRILFGEPIPQSRPVDLKFATDDRRDNRDPEKVYHDLMRHKQHD